MVAALLLALASAAPAGAPAAASAPPRESSAAHAGGPLRAGAPDLAPRPERPGNRVGDWPVSPSGRTVSIEAHTTVDDALERIASAAGWNLVAHTGRLGKRALVVALRDVPVDEAVDAVLEGLPLTASRHGDTVTVAPRRVPGGAPVLAGFDRPTGKRFSGDFAEAPVAEALRKISDAAGLSVVFPPGLRGTVSGHFKEAPVEDALRAVLAQAGLTAVREGSILSVAPEGGGSLFVQGGRRGFAVQVDGLDALDGEDGEPLGQEAPDGGQLRGEGKTRPPVPEGGEVRERVAQGDQVIGSGERAGTVVAILGSVRLEPDAEASEVVAILGSVTLAPGADVTGQVVAVGGDVHVSPGARVGGDAVSVGGRILIDQGGEVDGQQTSVAAPRPGGLVRALDGLGEAPGPLAWRTGKALAEFVVFFLLGLLVMAVFPRRIERVTASLANEPVKAALTGVLATAALPVLLLLLVVTIVGIPFTAVLAFAVVLAAVVGYTALALHLGRALPLPFGRGLSAVQLAIGTAILVALGQIPVLGVLAWAAGWMFVLGVVLRTRFGEPPGAPPATYATVPPPVPPPLPQRPPPPAAGPSAR